MQIKILKRSFWDSDVVKFSQEDLLSAKWEEIGREFIYKDEMYDVVKVEIFGGKYIYHCIKDGKENHYRKYKDFVVSFFTVPKDSNAYIIVWKTKAFSQYYPTFIPSGTVFSMGKFRNVKEKYHLPFVNYSYPIFGKLFQPPEFFI